MIEWNTLNVIALVCWGMGVGGLTVVGPFAVRWMQRAMDQEMARRRDAYGYRPREIPMPPVRPPRVGPPRWALGETSPPARPFRFPPDSGDWIRR